MDALDKLPPPYRVGQSKHTKPKARAFNMRDADAFGEQPAEPPVPYDVQCGRDSLTNLLNNMTATPEELERRWKPCPEVLRVDTRAFSTVSELQAVRDHFHRRGYTTNLRPGKLAPQVLEVHYK